MFKNLILFRLQKHFDHDEDELQKALVSKEFKPCKAHDSLAVGWTAPIIPDDLNLVYSSKGGFLICYQKEEKKVPSALLKKEMKTKVEKLEQSLGRKLKKAEKDQIKDEVNNALLPNMPPKITQSYVWIDVKNEMISVDSGSFKKAEEALSFLRTTLGTLPCIPLESENSITECLTNWVANDDVPYGFALTGESRLESVMQGEGVLNTKEQDLILSEIKAIIDLNKIVTLLGISVPDKLSFVVDSKFQIKKIKFGKEVFEANKDLEGEAAQKMGNIEITLAELRLLIPKLLESFGGEKK